MILAHRETAALMPMGFRTMLSKTIILKNVIDRDGENERVNRMNYVVII